MLTKRINIIVVIVSQLLNFAFLMIAANMTAKLLWWMINPAINEVYVEKTSASTYEKSAKYVINRYPFGIIQLAKESAPEAVVIPKVASQIKVSGVYQNTADHSVAIIEYSGKTNVYGIGSLIADSALVTAIESNGVKVSEDGKETFVAISQGNADAANPSSSSNSGRSGMPYTPPPSANSAQNNGQQNNYQDDAQRLSGDEIREKRRRMIEEFTRQQNGGGDSNTNNSSSNNANNSQNNAGNNNQQVQTMDEKPENGGENRNSGE